MDQRDRRRRQLLPAVFDPNAENWGQGYAVALELTNG